VTEDSDVAAVGAQLEADLTLLQRAADHAVDRPTAKAA
jgi:hypothetical protein